jgi:hypothetical protein
LTFRQASLGLGIDGINQHLHPPLTMKVAALMSKLPSAVKSRLGAWQYVAALVGALSIVCAWFYVPLPNSVGGQWDLRIRSLGAIIAILSAAEFAYDQNPKKPADLSWRNLSFKEAFAIGNLAAALAALFSVVWLHGI